MLEALQDVPPGVIALRAVGKVTAEDFRHTVQPLLAEARRSGHRIRLLLQLGPDYEGFTAGAVRGKAETWLAEPHLLRLVQGYALVSDVHWIGEVATLASFVVRFPIRVFPHGDVDRALAWLASLPADPVGHAPTTPAEPR